VMTGKVMQALLLMFVFLGFGVDFSAGTVVGGFAISYLFLIISPTPSGIGVVETILPLALVSLRVPWPQAVVVTLTYRALTFWLPLALGAVAFRMLQRE
jgi:glycosyltransferase 2 family protein